MSLRVGSVSSVTSSRCTLCDRIRVKQAGNNSLLIRSVLMAFICPRNSFWSQIINSKTVFGTHGCMKSISLGGREIPLIPVEPQLSYDTSVVCVAWSSRFHKVKMWQMSHAGGPGEFLICGNYSVTGIWIVFGIERTHAFFFNVCVWVCVLVSDANGHIYWFLILKVTTVNMKRVCIFVLFRLVSNCCCSRRCINSNKWIINIFTNS